MQKKIENGRPVWIADEGMVLTDNSSFVTTVCLGKQEELLAAAVKLAEEAEKQMNAEPAEDDATEADYQAELRRMGVKV